MTGNADTHHGRLERLLGPSGGELGCEQCFGVLDRCAELELAGVDYDAEVPGMRSHLDGCPACAEEFETLRALVASERFGGGD